jgi:hypothetical protein
MSDRNVIEIPMMTPAKLRIERQRLAKTLASLDDAKRGIEDARDTIAGHIDRIDRALTGAPERPAGIKPLRMEMDLT